MLQMETSLYHDEGLAHESNSVKKLKRTMTLDFASGPSAKRPKALTGLTPLLGSPELKLLQLASPELERMIIAQNGMVTTTPTPTQFLCPKSVTEEQEAYARGFVDALNELHKNKNNVTQIIPACLIAEAQAHASSQVHASSHVAAVQTSPAAHAHDSPAGPDAALPHHVLPHSGVARIKQEEPQTVPTCSPSPPIMHPIDMSHQEDIKLERKRERNRVAARKCRTRKLQRISVLEDRVAELKGQNSELNSAANLLREQVMKLKQQIMEHVNTGCQVMLAHV